MIGLGLICLGVSDLVSALQTLTFVGYLLLIVGWIIERRKESDTLYSLMLDDEKGTREGSPVNRVEADGQQR